MSSENPVKIETNPLTLRRSFGFNSSVSGTVHNLTTPSRKALFYVSAHTGVIHDTQNDRQFLLQGHTNAINAVAVSSDKRWLATADSGNDSLLIIWDSNTAAPIKVLQLPPEDQGATALDMSADSMFLVTLSKAYPQRIRIWEWTVNTSAPAISSGWR